MSIFDNKERVRHEGKVYILVLAPAPEQCDGCAFRKPGYGCQAMSFSCGASIAVEDTPEGLAKYIAARMTA